MIFSKFFKNNAWQHKDATVRVTAINEELSADNIEQKEILLSMLANDDSELVRRAILVKLNKFDVWFQACQHNSNKKIREFAQAQTEKILSGQHELVLSTEEKRQLLTQSIKASWLELLLHGETDAKLVLDIYHQLNKPQRLNSLFAEKQQEEVQLALLDEVSQIDALEKLLKKTKLAAVEQEIKRRIEQLTLLAEKPAKVIKQTQLVLAKYLALKDTSDYQQLLDKKQALQNEWQQISQEFDCLAEEQKQQFCQKYSDIEQQLTKIFAHKAEAFEQQKIKEQVQQEKQRMADEIEQVLKDSNQLLSNSIFENTPINEAEFLSKLDQKMAQVEQSLLSEQQKKNYSQAIGTIKEKLSKLPEIAQSVTEATHLISKISQITLPENLAQLQEQEPDYRAWLNQWQEVVNKAEGTLPESILTAHQAITQSWNQALAPLHKEQNHVFGQAQRKISDVKRLITNGKFNAAFGVFKKASSLYQKLSQSQQFKLQRDYSFIEEKIAELSDWEHYIATPRKQELLEQIKQLAEQPLDNPSEQAAKVKQYRKQWNSLGHADDEIEQALNNEFNVACEQAFAPCRLFYAEQEKIREQHLTTRIELLEQVKAFSQALEQGENDWQAIDAKLNRFKQQWRSAGEVERSKYQELNASFNALLKPVKTAIHSYHKDNVVKKQKLIEQAEATLTIENIDTAVAEIKSLQAKWRDVGYCGPKDENKLWQQFRGINDQVFARREQKQQAEQEQHRGIAKEMEDRLAQIQRQLEENVTLSSLNDALEQLQQIKSSINSKDTTFKALAKQFELAIKSAKQQLVQLKEQEKSDTWKQAFEVLAQSISKPLEEIQQFSQLSNHWQKKLKSSLDQQGSSSRLDRTIILEILAGVESPDNDKERRLTLQVELMQEQLSTGQQYTVEDAFEDWLTIGALVQEDLLLLERIKPIFIK